VQRPLKQQFQMKDPGANPLKLIYEDQMQRNVVEHMVNIWTGGVRFFR
jgi:hypothetical protein